MNLPQPLVTRGIAHAAIGVSYRLRPDMGDPKSIPGDLKSGVRV